VNQPWIRALALGREFFGYSSGSTHRRRPGTRFAVRPPGPRCAAPVGGDCAGSLCLPRPGAVQCRGEGGLGPLQGPTYRLYNCRRCAMQVLICTRCDHGNIYCEGECSRIRRRESLQRAGARYQHTRHGAVRHAARQRAWRASHAKMTHQGSPSGAVGCSVSDHPTRSSEPTDASVAEPTHTTAHGPQHRCAFCGAALPAWTRFRLWQWSG
jgi:hypothetical protein